MGEPGMRLFIFLVVVAVLGFAPAPFPRKERAQRDDMAAMTGTWELTVWESNGNNDVASTQRYVIEISDNKYIFVTTPVTAGSSRTNYELILHRNLVPRGFEWKMGGRTSYIGSYKLEGELLTMIFKSGANIGDRPIDFGGRHEFRFVHRRTKR
jgi:uncharacterized protein (TIGR03067 family)